MKNEKKDNVSLVVAAIRSSYKETSWMKYARDEVKKKVDHLLDNLLLLGPSYKDSFITLFVHTNRLRFVKNETVNSRRPSVLFGTTLPEETYQSGIIATRVLFDLDDWFQPNEADVYLAMKLWEQLVLLDEENFFEEPEKEVDNIVLEKLLRLPQSDLETDPEQASLGGIPFHA